MKYNKNELIKLFEHALELEEECHTQERLVAELQYDVEEATVGPLQYGPPIRELDSESNFNRGREIYTNIPFFIRVIILIAETFFVVGPLITNLNLPFDAIIALVLSYVLSNAVCMGIAALIKMKNQKVLDKEYDATLIEYNEYLNDNSNAVEVANKRIAVLNANISIAKDGIDKFNKMKNELYSYGFCYKDYQNLSAVANILQYLKSGRCETLEGPFGAYNKFAEESNQAVLQNKLDIIMDSLEQLKESQCYLYNALLTVNSTVASLKNGIEDSMAQNAQILANSEEITRNSALTARNAAATERHVEFMSMMTALSGQYNPNLYR